MNHSTINSHRYGEKLCISIGKFEDYKPLDYWIDLLTRSGFIVTKLKIVKWNVRAPYIILKKLINEIYDKWRRDKVGEKYLEELNNILNDIEKEGGMLWSDIYVILGKTRK